MGWALDGELHVDAKVLVQCCVGQTYSSEDDERGCEGRGEGGAGGVGGGEYYVLVGAQPPVK